MVQQDYLGLAGRHSLEVRVHLAGIQMQGMILSVCACVRDSEGGNAKELVLNKV